MSSYGGYIERLSRKVEARLTDIEAVFNFDFGSEFEVAMCLLLMDVLPAKFGICRGFVVTEDGRTAGDDIIIYDKMSCPTLRSNAGLQFSVKEQIPVDAVYAYFECKHGITQPSVFDKAMQQVRDVKQLLLTRPRRENPDFESNGPIYNGKVRDWPRTYPRLKNQPFCGIVARIVDTASIGTMVHDAVTPDLLILGRDQIGTQSVLLGPDGIKGSLFYDELFWSGLRVESAKGNAFGIGLVTLLQALAWIELVSVDWVATLNEAFASILFGERKDDGD